MLKLPKSIVVEAGGRQIRISFTEISNNVFVVSHNVGIHAMRNADEITFGYVVIFEDYLYAWCVTEGDGTDGKNHKLVYMCYVGGDNGRTLNEDEVLLICRAFALAVTQLARHENRHPAMIDRERFTAIYEVLHAALSKTGEIETAYVQPVYDTAVDLQKFYTNMVTVLEELLDKSTHH